MQRADAARSTEDEDSESGDSGAAGFAYKALNNNETSHRSIG